MKRILTIEEQVDMWIANVRMSLEHGNVEAALAFLDSLKTDWEKYKQGESVEPIAIHTGLLVEYFEGKDV